MQKQPIEMLEVLTLFVVIKKSQVNIWKMKSQVHIWNVTEQSTKNYQGLAFFMFFTRIEAEQERD